MPIIKIVWKASFNMSITYLRSNLRRIFHFWRKNGPFCNKTFISKQNERWISSLQISKNILLTTSIWLIVGMHFFLQKLENGSVVNDKLKWHLLIYPAISVVLHCCWYQITTACNFQFNAKVSSIKIIIIFFWDVKPRPCLPVAVPVRGKSEASQ